MTKNINETFATDVLRGLKEFPKRILSKYFYDSEGDKLFRKIMESPEYYVTDCELEIFTDQVPALSRQINCNDQPFDLIELGPGDGSKTVFLLRQLIIDHAAYQYLPIDISADMINHLEINLPVEVPGVSVKGFHGDYLEMLKKAVNVSTRRKVVLFLGGNIGNFTKGEAVNFIKEIHAMLNSGDILITGFDLIKHPGTIRNAYDDGAGLTSRFNLNLLHRINRELNADFDVSSFEHYCSYEPETGSCKSYLISLNAAEVQIGNEQITFAENEFIWTEISQKYTLKQTENLAYACGFLPSGYFVDRKNWFADTLWMKI